MVQMKHPAARLAGIRRKAQEPVKTGVRVAFRVLLVAEGTISRPVYGQIYSGLVVLSFKIAKPIPRRRVWHHASAFDLGN